MSELSEDLFNDTPDSAPKATRPAWAKDKVTTRDMRSSREYKKFRALFFERCAVHRNPDGSRGKPCHICGEPIRYDLAYPHPLSFQLDHLIPVSGRPDLLIDPGNAAPSHMQCNSLRSDDEITPELGNITDW